MFVFGVRHTLPPFGRRQLAVRDDVRYADHVPQQREPEPPSGTGERAHIAVRQIQPVRLGRTVAVRHIGQHHAGDRQRPGRGQSQPVQLLVSTIGFFFFFLNCRQYKKICPPASTGI